MSAEYKRVCIEKQIASYVYIYFKSYIYVWLSDRKAL